MTQDEICVTQDEIICVTQNEIICLTQDKIICMTQDEIICVTQDETICMRKYITSLAQQLQIQLYTFLCYLDISVKSKVM